MTAVLNGVRVLDFGRYIAGPYCGALLAEYGADVIRIEKRDGSEDRFTTPVADGVGSLFLQMNRNKRCMTLDPQSAAGREVVARLVRSADVVIANLPEDTLKRMGLDYDTLCSLRPDIIFVTSNAYGPVGPWAGHVGFDGIGQVMCGTTYMTGEPGAPMRSTANWVDFGTALHCAFGTLTALMQRQQTGRGQVVRGALLATALAVNNGMLIEQAVIASNRTATRNRGQTAAPSDIFTTRDGFVLVAIVGQPLFKRWAKLMTADAEASGQAAAEPQWLTDPRFADDLLRGQHGELISARMGRWCAGRSNDEVLAVMGAAFIPSAPVLSPQQALDHPQTQAIGLLKPVDYPGLPKPAPVASVPLWMSVNTPVPMVRPPLLGEHTEQVLTELGYSETEIDTLRAQGAV